MELSGHDTFRVALSDLNGQMRGKLVAADVAGKLEAGATRMPLSVLNLDIFGADIEDSPLVFESGDADGMLLPTGRGPVPLPWLEGSPLLVPMQMHLEGGAPFEGDPRHALAAVLERYGARGWQVAASCEMEFTLIDDSGRQPAPPEDPATGRKLAGADILALDLLDRFEPFFSDLYSACAAMGIPAQSAISESGVGQFEVTLTHTDALEAADNAWLFKALVRGMARRHGLAATFMAKPYLEDAGNGMHVHFSVTGPEGNIFDDGGPEGTALLRQAVAGCLAAMPEATLIFAPHGGSYARLVPGAHAPTGAGWGYENRTAAIRIPGGAPAARRIEHRVAGGDVNPYLLLAAILGAALVGIEDALEPPAPIEGNAYEADLPQLAPSWSAAVDALEASERMRRILPAGLIGNLVMTKRQEIARLAELPESRHWQVYLERV